METNERLNKSQILLHTNIDISQNEYARRRNADRPSVIYFHGLREKSIETEDILAKDGTAVKRALNREDEDFKSTSERKLAEHTRIFTRDSECLEIEEECLRKRHRTSFTSFQLTRLEEEFDQDCYIVGMKRWKLSEELEIPEKQIKIWFQNKRTKIKKRCSNCAHK